MYVAWHEIPRRDSKFHDDAAAPMRVGMRDRDYLCFVRLALLFSSLFTYFLFLSTLSAVTGRCMTLLSLLLPRNRPAGQRSSDSNCRNLLMEIIITSRNPGMSCTLSQSIAACTYVRVLLISTPRSSIYT